ncbi:S-receptor-like serine/threonine-protein kinase [Trema orientale]|uniref:Receptor-like serine/threonine-protein kinase n=1 Tax=Trema orientale TaxID=63057 RepID=A0A2P5B9F2_TREOI|nr:S-receptor-like serine/threonine-protein kinase [Trema orientale]
MGAKYRDCSLSLLFPTYVLLCLFPSQYCNETYNITQFKAVSIGQTIVSPNQKFELGFFSPNNSRNQYIGIWYKGVSPLTVVWVANRENPLPATDSLASLVIGSNGNLELTDGNHISVWSTNVSASSSSSNSSISLLSDKGNLVLKDGTSGEILWQSFDHPGDTFLPDTVLGFNAKTGQSYVLTSWRSYNDPSLGNFVFGISSQRPPQAFIWNNDSTPHWRSGPWDKLKFIGIPEMESSYRSALDIVEDVEKGTTYLAYSNWYNTSTVSKFFISPEGVGKLIVKREGSDYWSTNWEGMKSTCELYGMCGPFGVCKATESPICKCLKGFVPKSYGEWSRGNWTGGCVRRTELLCEKSVSSPPSEEGKKDGFLKMGMMKLPDFHEYLSFASADDCNIWCMNNCSCIAYAYVNGIGCLVWSKALIDIQEFSIGGQDLFLRVADAELVRGQKNKKIIITSLAAVFSSVALGAMALFIHKWRSNKGKIKETSNHFNSIKMTYDLRDTLQFPRQQQDPSDLPIFDFHSILVATNRFNIMNKLGQGGFGPVYKGRLQDGKEIAVKRLSSNSGQGIEEFKNEMILISKLQHRNLVRLLGCCIEKEERLLVYEFMPNKSLDNFIFDRRRREKMTWATRFNIIHGIARGLLYLHRDSYLRVIHRDLKASNILLDEKLNPKISDFGLARIFQGTIDLANTRRFSGYMSPEYAMGGNFSEKSDVFSFGVLILEIVGGRKNTSFNYSDEHQSLIAYAWKLWSEGRGIDLVDKALSNSYCSSEAMTSIHIALLCVQDHPIDRPSMSDVVLMLSNGICHPQPKQPIFIFHRSPRSGDVQLQNTSKCSVDGDTISLVEGR